MVCRLHDGLNDGLHNGCESRLITVPRTSREKLTFDGERIMLGWALTFLVLALIAAAFGFGGIAAGSASIAKILFFLFLVLFVVSLIANFRPGSNRI